MDYKKDLAIQCRKNLNSSSDEYMLEITDASFRHIDELLMYSSKMLDSHLCQVKFVESLKCIRQSMLKY
jgi:hypothetical protein